VQETAAAESSPATKPPAASESAAESARAAPANEGPVDAASSAADPQPSTVSSEMRSEEDGDSAELRFTFSNTPWREVLNWLADGADVALHINELPTGSFTYSDPRSGPNGNIPS